MTPTEREEAIRYHEDRISEMERGEIRWYREDTAGRLTVDDTERMLQITKASLALHRQLARLDCCETNR
jgi:hypothetical protein